MARRPSWSWILALVALAAALLVLVAVRRARPLPVTPALAPALPGPPAANGPVGTASPATRPGMGQAASHVEGHVRDALTRAPIAGVDVLFSARGVEATATSDAEGRFAIELGAGRYAVRVVGEGVFGLAPAPLALGVGTRVASYDLIVARLASVHGRVVDADGQAAAGAAVSWRSVSSGGRFASSDLDAAGLVGTATSGTDGGFELRVVPGEVTLSALRAGRRGRLVLPLVTSAQALSGAELVLDAGGGVVGVVRDPAGHGVAGASIAAVVQDGPGGLRARAMATSGADGRFVMRDLPPGPVRLDARARGFAPSAPLTSESATDAAEVVLLLRAPLVIAGRVIGPDGQPVAGARVIARHAGEILESPAVVAGADGRFVLDDLEPGPHDLDASAEGFGGTVRRQVGAPAQGLELRLQAVGGLAGRVTGAGNEAVVDFEVRWSSVLLAPDTPGRRGATRFLAADGAFRVEGLSAGSYEVTVVAPGHAPRALRVSVTPASFADASVQLEGGATLAGRVVDQAGVAIAGARVEVMTGAEGDAVTTDEAGRFAVAQVAPGRRSLTASHPGYVTRSETGIQVGPGERRSVDVTLTALTPGEAATPGLRPVEFAGIGAMLAVRQDGVMLTDFVPGGPAERAGLARGDLVLSVEGRSVLSRTLGDITEDIRGVAGTAVRLEVRRGTQTSTLDVVRGNVRFGG